MNLVDRYAEELRRSHEELANILERLRVGKLKQAGRTAVSRQTDITLNFLAFFMVDSVRKLIFASKYND